MINDSDVINELLNKDPFEFALHLEANSLIHIQGRKCILCQSDLELRFLDYEQEKVCLRCSNSNCRRWQSITLGSFFEGKHSPVASILQIIQGFILEDSITSTARRTNLTPKSVSHYFQLFRSLISEDLSISPILFNNGGVYEADETVFHHVMLEDGTYLEYMYVAGFIERMTGYCYLHIVPNRSSQSLIPILFQKIPRGSVIFTDAWPSYNQLDVDYIHRTINHSAGEYVRQELIDGYGEISVNSNMIEGLWKHLKRKIINKRCRTVNFTRICLDELMFRSSGRSFLNLIKV